MSDAHTLEPAPPATERTNGPSQPKTFLQFWSVTPLLPQWVPFCHDHAWISSSKPILGSLKGTVVIDEIQKLPSVFPALRVLADKPGTARFVISGSVSPQLIHS